MRFLLCDLAQAIIMFQVSQKAVQREWFRLSCVVLNLILNVSSEMGKPGLCYVDLPVFSLQSIASRLPSLSLCWMGFFCLVVEHSD